MFSDDNLTVYSYTADDSRHLKRKRDDEEPTSTLAILAEALGFTPGSLTGNMADKWRQAVIADMFPGSGGRSKSIWPSPAYSQRPLPEPRSTANTVLSYLVLGPVIRGKFLVQKAKARGIKPGKLYGKLTNGEAVQAPDGTTVDPSEVMEPATPASAFALFDLPDKKALSQATATAIKMKQQLEKRGAALKVVYHWLGPDVIFEPAFVELAKAFGDVKHVIASPESTPNYVANSLQALLQLRLARLDPQIFSIPSYNLSAVFELPVKGAEHWKTSHRAHMAGGESVASHMKPPRRFSFTVPSAASQKAESLLKGRVSGPNAAQTYARAAKAWKEYVKLSTQAAKDVRAATPPPSQPGDDVLVTPLGTGSSVASMYRNGAYVHELE